MKSTGLWDPSKSIRWRCLGRFPVTVIRFFFLVFLFLIKPLSPAAHSSTPNYKSFFDGSHNPVLFILGHGYSVTISWSNHKHPHPDSLIIILTIIHPQTAKIQKTHDMLTRAKIFGTRTLWSLSGSSHTNLQAETEIS